MGGRLKTSGYIQQLEQVAHPSAFANAVQLYQRTGNLQFQDVYGRRRTVVRTPTQANTGLLNYHNWQTNVLTHVEGGMEVYCINRGGFGSLYKAAPTPPYRITGGFAGIGTSAQTHSMEFGWMSSTSGLFHVCYRNMDFHCGVGRFDDSFGGLILNYTANIWFSHPFWYQIEDDGTSVWFRQSFDGVCFHQMFTCLKSAGFLNVYDRVIWGMTANISGPVVWQMFEWTEEQL